jgi:hypothetical protein
LRIEVVFRSGDAGRGNAKLNKCPGCAEQVQAEARKCRFCGYDSLGIPSLLVKPDQAGMGCAILAVIGLLIFASGGCRGIGAWVLSLCGRRKSVQNGYFPESI